MLDFSVPETFFCDKNKQSIHLRCIVPSYLRLRERSLTGGVGCAPSSSTTLSVLRKCLNRKWRSSCVGWKGNWCNNSWEEEDWEKERTVGENSVQT